MATVKRISLTADPEPEELDPDSAARLIDSRLDAFRRGVLTLTETFESVRGTASLFMRFAVASAADVDLVIDYARVVVEELAFMPEVMDPVLLESFDNWLQAESTVGELQVRLDALLEPLIHAAKAGDPLARGGIADLCRDGRRTHPHLLSRSIGAEEILRAAYEVGCAEGLRDAVSPACRCDGQIAHKDASSADATLALDLLAQLAADPERGAGARDALLDLADQAEIAGEAVVRLPLHLLDRDHCRRLFEIHEARLSLFGDDPVIRPLGIDLLRDNRLVRGAVWQAYDAQHLR